MEIKEAVRSRRSTRDFFPDPVPDEAIVSILETAKWCGSFMNSQPWKCAVLGGDVMRQWKDALWEMHCSGEREDREYSMGPMPLPEIYANRTEAFVQNIDGLMFPPGIDNWQERRDAYTRSGTIVRDAPNAIVVHMDKELAESPLYLLAAGGFVQAVALCALEEGLGSCVMGRPVESPGLLRRITGIPDTDLILCCIALGYRNPDGRINSLERVRAPLEEIATWHGFRQS